jgi:hypothetical protein
MLRVVAAGDTRVAVDDRLGFRVRRDRVHLLE